MKTNTQVNIISKIHFGKAYDNPIPNTDNAPPTSGPGWRCKGLRVSAYVCVGAYVCMGACVWVGSYVWVGACVGGCVCVRGCVCVGVQVGGGGWVGGCGWAGGGRLCI